MEKMRTFIALDLPDTILASLKDIQKDVLKQDLFIGKLTEPENLHLTLKFFGTISLETVRKIQERLRMISIKQFDATIDELGVFSEEFVRIIWTRLSGAGVSELQKSVDNALVDLFPKENRFMSHLTIARVKNLKDKNALLAYVKDYQLKEIKGTIKSFSLIRSTLMPSGPIYEVIEKYSLK